MVRERSAKVSWALQEHLLPLDSSGCQSPPGCKSYFVFLTHSRREQQKSIFFFDGNTNEKKDRVSLKMVLSKNVKMFSFLNSIKKCTANFGENTFL